MQINNMTELLLSLLALGMLLLTLQLLLLRVAQQRFLLPLIIALASMAVIISGPAVFQLFPEGIFLYIAALPIVFFMLPVSLYQYTQALSADKPWHWQWRYSKGYWSQLIAIPLALLIYTLPEAQQQALFFADETDLQGQMLLTAVGFLLVTLLWLGLSLFYLVRTTLLLKQYRDKLHQVFAADTGKRLYWLNGLMAVLLLSWGYAVLVLLVEDAMGSPWLNETGVLLLALILVWLLCSCGLNQLPGFTECYKTPNETMPLEVPIAAVTDKYQRSALGDEQAQRIAHKVRAAVYDEAIYLDPALTLYKLAEHIGVSVQYLSQTLNQTLQQSFYDYINDARIVAAQQQLQQTEDSVLTIAMAVGFNARSTFYKAFKHSTGLTPAQYRAKHRA